MPLNHAATLISSVDWGLGPLTPHCITWRLRSEPELPKFFGLKGIESSLGETNWRGSYARGWFPTHPSEGATPGAAHGPSIIKGFCLELSYSYIVGKPGLCRQSSTASPATVLGKVHRQFPRPAGAEQQPVVADHPGVPGLEAPVRSAGDGIDAGVSDPIQQTGFLPVSGINEGYTIC